VPDRTESHRRTETFHVERRFVGLKLSVIADKFSVIYGDFPPGGLFHVEHPGEHARFRIEMFTTVDRRTRTCEWFKEVILKPNYVL
jgi:hypothetical protein